jgi:putative oxidoreductase
MTIAARSSRSSHIAAGLSGFLHAGDPTIGLRVEKEVEMFKLANQAFWGQWAPLPLRLVIGYGFVAHGWAKLSRGPAGFGRLLEQVGAPLPDATAWASTVVEILGGLAILAGAFVAVVSIPLIIMMLVAMFTVHLRYGFSAINTIGLTANGPQFSPPGIEVNLLYIAGLLALILAGAGPFSIDRLLSRGRQGAAPHDPEPRAAGDHPAAIGDYSSR